MRQEYSTKQRSAILELISNSSTHITAAEIINHLREKGVSVSVATVYRTLDKLEREGTLKKMNIGDGAGACYQYTNDSDCKQHFHLKCIECGELIHLSCEFLHEMEKHIFDEHAFTISSGKTVIYGKCARCAKISDKKCHTLCECNHNF